MADNPQGGAARREAQERQERNERNESGPFKDTRERHAFVRKVLGIVALQILVTIAILTPFVLIEEIKRFSEKYFWIDLIFICSFFLIFSILIFWKSARRKSPYNIILLILFTLSLALALSFSSAKFSNPIDVLIAFGVTFLLCILLIIFSLQMRFEFIGFLVFFLLIIWITLTILILVVIWFHNEILRTIIFSCFIIGFSLYIVIIMQLMLKGKGDLQIDPKKYINAVIVIYVAIVVIFESFLRIITQWLS